MFNRPVKRVYIAADHQAQEAQNMVLDYLNAEFGDVDVICTWKSFDGDDYTDVAQSVTNRVGNDMDSRGILICGSGTGVCMAANRDTQIRAAACYFDNADVTFARRHEDASVLCLSAWWTPSYVMQCIIRRFLLEPFEGGRHLRRIHKAMNFMNG